MRPVSLEITDEIINVAVQRDSAHCVIADAFRLARPDLQRISVDLQTIRATDPADGTRYLWFTPAAAQALLVNFDLGVPPEPQTIRLVKPCQVIRQSPKARAAKRKRNALLAARRKTARNARTAATPTIDGSEPYIAAGDQHGQPTKVDGEAPPIAALASTRGRRRTFGLRSLRA